MHKTHDVTLSETTATRWYRLLLAVYPRGYQQRFGQEMLFTFHDLYQEELKKYDRVRIAFCVSLFRDALLSATAEHIVMIHKQGIKQYFHITRYTIIGALLLVPFLTLLGLDVLGRLIQGDLAHYNKSWYAAITQSALYREPLMLQAIFIFAPLLAVVLNLIPILASLRAAKKPTVRTLFLANPLALGVSGLGLLCLFIIYGHDVVPCMVNGLFSHGFQTFFNLIAVCRNA
jgi:hypothetical protein